MPDLHDLIADGRVHVFDGAMGTMLYARGVFVNVCYDELNLKQPNLVRDVHREYVKAGAEVLETNTFGANPMKLSAYGLADQTEAINQAAATLARGRRQPQCPRRDWPARDSDRTVRTDQPAGSSGSLHPPGQGAAIRRSRRFHPRNVLRPG